MKNLLPVLAILVAALTAAPVHCPAQGGPPPWAGSGPGRAARAPADAELDALDRFLSMSDAELDSMQQAIARVRAMSTDERAKLRAEIAAFHGLPEERRNEIRSGWGWHDARDRTDWREMMTAKSPEEHAAIQRELLALDPAARMARKRALLEAWRRERAATP